MINEDQLEQLCLEWFRTCGYDHVYGPDIGHDGEAPERDDYRQVILLGRLLSALQKINPHIPFAALEGELGSGLTYGHSALFQNAHKSSLTRVIVAKSGEKKIRSTAWRVACRKWLEENDLVLIRKMQAVLPTF